MVSVVDPCNGRDLADLCNFCDLRDPPSATGESGWVMGFIVKPAVPPRPGCVPRFDQILTITGRERQAAP